MHIWSIGLETSDGMRKLHFGCFDQIYEGWVNTDITPRSRIARIPFLPEILHNTGFISRERLEQHRQGIFKQIRRLDLTKRFPFKDGEFSAAFSSHVLEHLYHDQAAFALREVHRVLEPGGILRVAVPDLDKCISEYDPSNPDDFCAAIFESRQVREKNQHHWMYNESSLGTLLRNVGFSEVNRCDFKQGICPDVSIIDNRPESLFMEAVK
jgi:SAM-dependent methyltransferase